ncbi:Arginine--tRNA ligase cytoplasmic [Zalerion maritima]|uniref:arginine--tRNA ligase n=1 Tax=Zalerion maritima TaxID=339359 RepID=A0AAD5RTR3_9PEZI|nr:Arginine--tRNA ligase cytoplasmic [Zalerion maritima]
MDHSGHSGHGSTTSNNSFSTANKSIARGYWYGVAGVIGSFAVVQIIHILQARHRLRKCRTESSPSPTTPTTHMQQFWATITAVVREMSYPQLHIPFKGLDWISPPPLGRVLILLLYWAVIVGMMVDKAIIKDAFFWERIGYRNAWVTVMQIPLLYMLASKSNIIALLIGSSHERLNWLHRWVARTILVTASVHGWHFWTQWVRADFVEFQMEMMPMTKYGLGAWGIILWMNLTGMAPFRRLAYEVFVAQHIVSAAVLLWLVYVHIPADATYFVWWAVAALCFDRLFRLGLLLWQNTRLHVDKSTCESQRRLGHQALLEAIGKSITVVTIKDVHFSWRAGQHIYLWMPEIGPIEAHPYTIACRHQAVDGCCCNSVQLVIRAHKGFSRRVHDRASGAERKDRMVKAFLSGPYGAPPQVEIFETLVLISASTGASFTLPILEGVLQPKTKTCTTRVDFILISRDDKDVQFYTQRISDAIVRAKNTAVELKVFVFITAGGGTSIEVDARRQGVAGAISTSSRASVSTAGRDGGEKGGILVDVQKVSTSPKSTVTRKRSPGASSIEEPSIQYPTGRPDINELIRTPVEAAGGETSVIKSFKASSTILFLHTRVECTARAISATSTPLLTAFTPYPAFNWNGQHWWGRLKFLTSPVPYRRITSKSYGISLRPEPMHLFSNQIASPLVLSAAGFCVFKATSKTFSTSCARRSIFSIARNWISRAENSRFRKPTTPSPIFATSSRPRFPVFSVAKAHTTTMASDSVDQLAEHLKKLPISDIAPFPNCYPKDNLVDVYRSHLTTILHNITGVDTKIVYVAIGWTNSLDKGDMQMAIPALRVKGKKPDELGAEWLAKWPEDDPLFEKPIQSGPFFSFFYKPGPLAKALIPMIQTQGASYGQNKALGLKDPHDPSKGKKKIVVEFSSPNIAKPFHAGHLRSTIIGGFLANLYSGSGWDVTRINYLGDWGKQYGLLALGFDKYGNEDALLADPINHLYELYVKINKDMSEEKEEVEKLEKDGKTEEAAKIKNEGLDEQARRYFKKMTDGDPGALAQWKRFRDLSIIRYKSTYARLNIKFDVYAGESLVPQKKMDEINEELQQKDITEESDGALIINFAKHVPGKAGKTLERPILRKKDGTALYLTRDVSELLLRHDKYQFDKMIYVVASQQDLHLKQLFKIIELMGHKDIAEKCQHINFGLVLGMSTRRGTVKFLDDILRDVGEKMHEVMKKNDEKYQQVENPDATADVLGISSVMVQDMTGKRNNNYKFNMEAMTSFEGDTGPYLQYAHARLCSIVRKAEIPEEELRDFNPDLLQEPHAIHLLRAMSQYPDVLANTMKTLEPTTIMTYLFKLTHSLSSSYDHLRIVGRERELMKARLALYTSAKTIIVNGMRLLGLSPVERM